MDIKIEWKVQDLWIGAYWENRDYIFHLWICLVPCVPIHIKWMKV